jgi:hypothetical protein
MSTATTQPAARGRMTVINQQKDTKSIDLKIGGKRQTFRLGSSLDTGRTGVQSPEVEVDADLYRALSENSTFKGWAAQRAIRVFPAS